MVTPIKVEDLTTIALNGTGTFDVLMQTVQLRLQEEYSKDRIMASDYSKVYLGALETVLGQSIQFLLSKDKAANEAALIEAQVRLAEASIVKMEKESELVDAQILKLTADIELVAQQIILSKEQQLNLAVDRDKSLAETALIQQNERNAIAQNANILKQQAKIEAETGLLTQKKYTEEAQILDVVNGLPVAGAVGKDKALRQAQTDGFFRDAEQKLSKIMTDSWNIRRSTDEAEIAPSELDNDGINSVIAVAKAGIKR